MLSKVIVRCNRIIVECEVGMSCRDMIYYDIFQWMMRNDVILFDKVFVNLIELYSLYVTSDYSLAHSNMTMSHADIQ